MTLVWLLAFTIIGGAFGDGCERRIDDCYEKMPEDLPQNKEELDNACRELQDVLACALDVAENCIELEDEQEQEYLEMVRNHFKNILNFLEKSCNPNSAVYQVLSEKVECAYPVLKNINVMTPCSSGEFSQERKNVLKYFEERLMETTQSFSARACLSDIFKIACIVTPVKDKCGSDVLLPLTEVWSSIYLEIQDFCEQDFKDEVPLIVETFAFAEEKMEAVENEIKK